jgi:hypothetical protein
MRQLVLAHADVVEKLLLQNFTGMRVAKLAHEMFLSVIVHDLDIFDIALGPSEADTPLIVDADAHLSGAVPFQGFEPIGRRIAEVIDRRRSIKLAEFAQRAILNIARKLAAGLALPDSFGLLASERSDHGRHRLIA